MNDPLRVLIVEDNEDDGLLLVRELKRDFDVTFERVDTPEAMAEALQSQDWDVVISDYSMPRFSAMAALELVKELKPGLPFIIVSGTVGEEIAVEAIRAGAHDFMAKGSFARLIPAIRRELADATLRIERSKMQKHLLIADRLASVGTLAAGVAHEINTPVQYVGDSVHFLHDAVNDMFSVLNKVQQVWRLEADGAGSPESDAAISEAKRVAEEADLEYLFEHVPDAFNRCLDGLERVRTIVRSLREFAQPARCAMASVDLNRAVRNTLTVARNEYKYVAELETDFGELPPVPCFLSDINQVVLNLVVNAAHAIADAVKGSSEKGTLRVRTRQDGEYAVIMVSDTGTGIPDAIARRVFEPFFTTKEVGKGTGQGLALAWSLVKEKHGGQIDFETEVGKGTTFVVRLPIGSTPSACTEGAPA